MTAPASRDHIETAEASVQRSLPGLVAAIEADHLTRRGSLEQLRRMMAASNYSPNAASAAVLCLQLKDCFEGAGFAPLLPNDILQIAPAQVAADAQPGIPLSVREAARVANGLGCQVAALAAAGTQVAASSTVPWRADFLDTDGGTPGEVVLFAWTGDSRGDSYLGCLLAGAEKSFFLEETSHNPAGLLDTGNRHGVELLRLNAELGRLRSALCRFNELSALAANEGRLEVALHPETGCLSLSWKGNALLTVNLNTAPATSATAATAAEPLAAEDILDEAAAPGGGMR